MEIKKKTSNGRQIISDIKYSLVNKDCFIQSKEVKIKKTIKNIIIDFGLIDSKGFTLKVLKILFKNYKFFEKINFFIIIGAAYKYQNNINIILDSKKIKYKLLIETDKMYEYLSKSDLVIGSAGVSLLERVSMGIPSISISTAKNQITQLKIIESKKGTQSMVYPFTEKQFIDSLIELIQNFKRRVIMSSKAKQIITDSSVNKLPEKIISFYNEFIIKKKNENIL